MSKKRQDIRNKLNLHIKITISSFVIVSLTILAITYSNNVAAVEVFTVEAQIELSKIPDVEKLKVVGFANGESDLKFIDNIQDMKSKSISVTFYL